MTRCRNRYRQSCATRARPTESACQNTATTIRLSADVMNAFKATGAGWQTRIDGAFP
ncbi:MAG: BrnA antitoxin family protein [Azoarcus sp.]|nr:BrnA antitoxin family protein [Azoarcus sp.]